MQRRLSQKERAEDLGDKHVRIAVLEHPIARHVGRHFVDDVDVAPLSEVEANESVLLGRGWDSLDQGVV